MPITEEIRKLAQEKGFTAMEDALFHWACYTGQLDIVRLCLQSGENPNGLCKPLPYMREAAGYKRGTPLHAACSGGRLDVAKLLLDAGVIPPFLTGAKSRNLGY